ncbi:MAG: polyprenyl synthetase family protein [Kiritimatiellia bacterium]
MKAKLLALVEKTLEEVLPAADARPAVLSEAMRYAVGTGGKRIRPLVCLASALAVGGRIEDAAYPAAAIELLHNYTLVHDDLPAMDNDTLRRGQPTTWAKYGEANAILAGDALLALAYATAARAPRKVAEIIAVLGEKGVGVVQGQVEDIRREGAADRLDSATIDFIYTHKTSDLFVAAAMMGGLAAGGAPEAIDALRGFALNLGLAFQYEDDLLDGDSPYAKDETERLVRQTTEAAKASLASLPGNTDFLSELAEQLIGRTV